MAVSIVGGGIAGLTAALALRRAGVEATVFERVDDVAASQIGAGLGLAYNATRVLRNLGLLEQVKGTGRPCERFEFRGAKGELLSYWTVPQGEAQVGITRKALHQILVEALPAGALLSGRTCVRFEQDDESATAIFEDGRAQNAELLIGADGLRSVVRAQLHGDEPPRYAGFSVMRTVVTVGAESPLPPGVFRLFWGRGASFGMYFVGPTLVYIFGWSKTPEDVHVPRGERRQALLERFRSWSPEIGELLERSDEDSIYQTDICDRRPVGVWGAGRVTLAGDAAHPMTFNMGQGACQGLEDAAALARSVGSEGETPAALRAYEAARGRRAAEFTRQSSRAARLSVMGNPLACAVRNRLLRRAGKMIPRGEQMLMIEV